MMHPMQSNLDVLDLTLHEMDSGRHLFLFLFFALMTLQLPESVLVEVFILVVIH